MRVFVAIVLFSTLTCCSNRSMKADEFARWVESNKDIVATKTIDNYEFSLKYLPAAFLALRDLNGKRFTEKDLNSTEENYFCSYNLVFKIVAKDHSKDVIKEGADSKGAYFSKLQYFISGLQQDVFLADGTDTIRCSLCNFERTFNLNPYLTFYLLFDKKGRKNEHFDHDLTLIYNDHILGVGKTYLRIDKTDLNDIPKLKIP